MKLGKATIYFFTHNDFNSPKDALIETIESRDWVDTHLFDYQEVEIGTWYDEIPINYIGAKKDDYEKYFTPNNELAVKLAKKVAHIMETSEYTGITLEEAQEAVVMKEVEEITPSTLGLFMNQCKVEMGEYE